MTMKNLRNIKHLTNFGSGPFNVSIIIALVITSFFNIFFLLSSIAVQPVYNVTWLYNLFSLEQF